jgi:hypothetical protein
VTRCASICKRAILIDQSRRDDARTPPGVPWL